VDTALDYIGTRLTFGQRVYDVHSFSQPCRKTDLPIKLERAVTLYKLLRKNYPEHTFDVYQYGIDVWDIDMDGLPKQRLLGQCYSDIISLLSSS